VSDRCEDVVVDPDGPFGHLPEHAEDPDVGPRDVDPLLEEAAAVDPRLAGTVLPVRPPSSAHRIPSRYRQSAGASVLAAGLIGLRDVIDPARHDETVIEQEAAEDEVSREVQVFLDPDDPGASMVVIHDPADSN
jgi:hypothetical protein